MAEPTPKHAKFSRDDVIEMLDVSDEYDSEEYDDDDDDDCASEVICDGSNVEFHDFDAAEIDTNDHSPSDLEEEVC